MSFQDRTRRFLILSVLGFILGAGIAGLSILMESGDKNQGHQESLPFVAPHIGGPFHLINQDGKAVTDKDFAGKYLLIYFGFASCPAICPTELQKITNTYQSLSKDWQDRIQPIFITIDPERDTPDILKDYVALFLPQMVGLTGTTDQIENVKKAYKVYGAKVPEGTSYTMDHSSFIYFMGPDTKPLAMFRVSDTADKMTKTIQTLGINAQQ